MKGKSCEDAWEYVKLKLSKCESTQVIRVFVDFKDAFSNLFWKVILDKLHKIRCSDADSRNLSRTPMYPCRYERQDCVHILDDCEMYVTFRDVDAVGVLHRRNEWDVSRVLCIKDVLCINVGLWNNVLEQMAREGGG